VFPGRLAIQQRVLPAYRTGFFNTLAGQCHGGLSVFAGQPLRQEGIASAQSLAEVEYWPARNRHIRNPASSLYLCWQEGILNWLESWQPEALVVEANSRILSTRRAVRWMHTHGRPVLGWGLGAPASEGVSGWLRDLEKTAFLRSLDGWIAYSRKGAAEYRQLGLDPQRIFVAGNAVTPRPVASQPARPSPEGGPLKVLFVGRLQRRKRVDLLLQACATLPEDLQPRLVIVGDGPHRAEMEAQAQAIYSRAEFTGVRHGLELEALFQSADLFVLPGTGGLALQQAMSHGLPVIAAEGDGTQEDLVHPGNGWLVKPGNLDALVEALRQALGDRGRLSQMGLESYHIVREDANLERMAEVFVQAVTFVAGTREDCG
jgi:glycosyltransferase involved in cell wall biosynthesis